MTAHSEFLMTGDEYRESLRDGREIWYRGEKVLNVTTHPALAGGIDLLAEAYDQQHDPEFREVLTFEREDGARVSTAWMIPRSREDLRSRRACVEHLAKRTFGVFGRQMRLPVMSRLDCWREAVTTQMFRGHP